MVCGRCCRCVCLDCLKNGCRFVVVFAQVCVCVYVCVCACAHLHACTRMCAIVCLNVSG